MPKAVAILHSRDGSIIKQIEIDHDLYIPPKILIDGNDFYLRTSNDNIHSPLEFVWEQGVYKVPTA